MVNSKRIMLIECYPCRLNPGIIIRLLDSSLMVMPKSFIVDFGMILTAEPPSARIRLTFYPRIYPITNNGQLCGLEPNNKSSLVNVTVVLHVAHWAGLRVSGASLSLSAYITLLGEWQQQFVCAFLLACEKFAANSCVLVKLLGQ